MKISLTSQLRLHPLNIRKDKKFYIIEDQKTGDFYEMSEICVVAINMISEGFALDEIERELKEQFPQEEVNLVEFGEQLVDLNLVEDVDGQTIENGAEKGKLEKSGFTWISPQFASIFFNKITKFGFAALFLLNISIFLFNPHLFPHYKDVFIFEYMFQNVLFWLVVGGALVLFHEMGHILAIRSHNLPTKLEVGHRLFFIVLETDLAQGWKLSSKDRIQLYLSGIYFDNVLLFLALVVQMCLPNSSDIFLNIMAFIVLDVVIRFIYQCAVYMKTDLYYVLENLTGCHNLMENAKAILLKKKQELSVFKGEIKTIYVYTVFYFLGLMISCLLFIVYYVPQVVYTLVKITPGLNEPVFSVPFLDAIFVILQLVLLFGLLLFSWFKGWKLKKQ